MNKDKLLDLIVIVLVVAGCVAIIEGLIYMRHEELASLVRKIIAYSSVPFGLLIKSLKFLASERDKLNQRLEALSKSVTDNKTSIDLLRANLEGRGEEHFRQLAEIREMFDQLGDELQQADRELDRRLVVQESRSGLQQRIGELEQRVRDIDKLLLGGD